MERIVHGMDVGDALKILRGADGYYITNTTRDLSPSDFKNRILLHTDLLAAKAREKAMFLEPCICYSTGPEHTNEFYIRKVGEILEVTGPEILLCIKNHGGLGTPLQIGELVAAIKQKYPDLIIHYHGHNTDSNDVARITAAVLGGATIVDAADHAFTGYFGPPPILSVIHSLKNSGKAPIGLDEAAVMETSEKPMCSRRTYFYGREVLSLARA